MFELRKRFRFEAAHVLPRHNGKCARLHGHSWIAEVIIEGEELETEGSATDMLIDFGDISKAMKPLLENFLDHHHLNDTLPFSNPTSERVAQWIYLQLKGPDLPELKAVAVEETCTSKCVYYDL